MILDIHYVPRALPTADADLAYLTSSVAWRDDLRARRTASFGLPYDYSGQQYPACEMPPVIAAIAARAGELAGHHFNNSLCNRYETGENTMGFHADSYVGLVAKTRIAIASFGAARTLVFRSRDRLHRHELAWTHAILRTPATGCRISATFRNIDQRITMTPPR